MELQKRKKLKIIGVLIGVVILGHFLLQFIVKSKIETTLSTQLPETIKLTYNNLDLSLLKGKIIINNINLTSFGKTIQKPNVEVDLEALSINGFGYWLFLIKDLIYIDKINLKNPNIRFYYNPKIPKEEYQSFNKGTFNKHIEINEFIVDRGQVKIIDSETDSLKLQAENTSIRLHQIDYNKEIKTGKIPVRIESYQVVLNSFFGQLSDYENVTGNYAKLTNKAAVFKNLSLFTKYSKKELSRIIPFERDHYNLNVDSLTINRPVLDVVQDTVWKFQSSHVRFYQPHFLVYRDKLVADDKRIKPLYSKMLRDLKFQLNLENILIHDADIAYSEKVKANRKAGTISFSNFNADIKHVSNTYQLPTKTTLKIQSEFMKHTSLDVIWSFDVNNQQDLFEFQAEVGKLQANKLNSFTQPNLNVRLEGELDKTYFTISGTNNTSNIDLRVNYKDFDIIALRENGQEKNKLLSDVINLFVSKNSNKANQSFKAVSKHNIKRHKTQSVFNYIWISTRAGLLKALTID